MYFDYFGLKKNPFRITPDEKFLFLLEGHKRSYAYLKYTAWANDGFMLLTGEIGTGKTILLKKLISDLSSEIKIISISQTQLQLDDLLRILLYELTGSFEATSRAELIIKIRESLLDRKKDGGKTLLILDEAQNLNYECLEEVRLLADEMFDGENILNVILSGQPEIEHKINTLGLQQFKQRVRITYRLTALKESDIGRYIDFRTYIGFGYAPFHENVISLHNNSEKQLRGLDFKRLFDIGVDHAIYQSTRGVPRLINALCETSLVLSYGEKTKQVSEEIIKQAIDELGWLIEDDINDKVSSEHIDVGEGAFGVEVSLDGEIIKKLRVDTLPFSIGRSDSNDLVLGNKTVSKKHATLDHEGSQIIIRDCGSTNGLKVDGERVSLHNLSNGEVVQVGRYKLRFILKSTSKILLKNDTIKTMQLNN